MKRLCKGGICLLGCLLLCVDPSFGLQESQTYSYDFTDGAAGWELDDNWTLVNWDPGGQAIQGERDGIALHTEGAGLVRKVSFRFEMDQTLAYFCVRFGGPGDEG